MSTIDIDEFAGDTSGDRQGAGSLDFGDELDEDFFGLATDGDGDAVADDQSGFDPDDFGLEDLDGDPVGDSHDGDDHDGDDEDQLAFFDFEAEAAAEAEAAEDENEAHNEDAAVAVEVETDLDDDAELDHETEPAAELADDDPELVDDDEDLDPAVLVDDAVELEADGLFDEDAELEADGLHDADADADAEDDAEDDRDGGDSTSTGHVWVGAAKYDDADTDPTEGIWDAETGSGDMDDADLDDEADDEPMPLPKRARQSVPLEDEAAELDRIIADELVTMVYQPITSLLDDSVVGYEALARGPEDSPLATPASMFGAAENHDRLHELDLLCQTQAVLQARDVLLQSGHALFVNIEPSVIADAAFGRDDEAVESIAGLLSNMTASCPVVLEISDRYPYESAAEMLAIVMWARANGFRIALDDVAVSPHSLALLPLLEPDVIKLNRWVLNAKPDADLGLLLNTIRVQAERTGAAVVAQGIESAEDRELALAMGATHVQGFGVGLPAELSEAPVRIRSLEPVRASYAESAVSPFDLVASAMSRRTGNTAVIDALMFDLERQADEHSNSVILTNFEMGDHDHADIKGRYENLAKTSPFVVALAEDLSDLNEVYTGAPEPTDPLYNERSVVVLTPHFAAALLARRTGEVGTTEEFTFTVTYDRGLVTRAARLLIANLDI